MSKILELAESYAQAHTADNIDGNYGPLAYKHKARAALVAEVERVERDTELLVMRSDLWLLAVRKGIITVHQNTTVSWIEGHGKACDITNTYYESAMKGLK